MTEYYHEKKQYIIEADNFNELSGVQLIDICKLIISDIGKELADLKALHILLNINQFDFLKIPIDAKARMIEDIQWVFEIKGLTKQLITDYNKMYGPSSEWQNLTMEEWNDCEVYYHLYINENEEQALDKMLAVLYREAKPGYDFERNIDGDCRIPYNQFQSEYNATHIIKQWPQEVKMAILAWYDGCRELLMDSYDIFSNNNSGAANEPGMFELIRSLCGERFGNFKQVENLNVHIAMKDLSLTKQDNERLEAQLKSHS